MDRTWLRSGVFNCVLLILFMSSTNACIKNSDCGDETQYCCKSHCTSTRIKCSYICFSDEDCSRNHLCSNNVCVECSKRVNCDLKSCFNDTYCPTTHSCSKNHMCTKTKKPPKHNFTLLPFIIIIAVLGFALIILCYTEGCWREVLIYLKRQFGRYGRIARDEHEADQRDLSGIESGNYRHSNKSCVESQRIGRTNLPPSTQNILLAPSSNSNSPNMLRSTRVISLNNETRTMALSENGPSRSPLTVMTSRMAPSCQQDSRAENNVDVGSLPSLSHTITRNPSPLPPAYRSLFAEEDEVPPPKYDEVVNNMNTIPIAIEMESIRPASLATSQYRQIETTV